MGTYSRLTRDDRYQIKALVDSGFSASEIAAKLGRHRSTIGRELRRCLRRRYCPDRADNKSRLLRRSLRPKIRITGHLKEIIDEQLGLQLSPEQIAGRLKLIGMRISHETIYKYIFKDAQSKGELFVNLRRRRRKRRSHAGVKRLRNCGLRTGRQWIDERPPVIEARERLGDLERDCIVGGGSTHRLLTIVDRVSKLTWIKKLAGPTSAEAHEATVELLSDEVVLSITNDNGPEFGLHDESAKALETQIYFSNPYCSWERGTNENTNGLIRQYFPKGTDFSRITEDQIAEVEARLNTRPRKTLGYLTPIEVHEKLSQNVALGS